MAPVILAASASSAARASSPGDDIPFYQRRLTPLSGADGGRGLPMQTRTGAVKHLLQSHLAVGVRAPPGSGKTLILPEIVSSWCPSSRQAVLLVEPTRYAAEKLVDSFVSFRKWPRGQVHLRTGTDQKDEFHPGYTRLSVVTYGIVWKWLTGEGRAQLMERYKGFVLDEFAKVIPAPGFLRMFNGSNETSSFCF